MTRQYATKQPMDQKMKLKKVLQTNENENTMNQNLWDAAKAVLKGKLIAIQSINISIQTTLRYHLTLGRMSIIKKTTNNKC